jgi:hypothetical protein
MLNRNEVFQTVVNHIWQQKVKSAKKLTKSSCVATCMYRGPNGTKCAIGCLITDEEYDPKMETYGVSSVLRDYPIAAIKINEDTPDHFFIGLQGLHDDIPASLKTKKGLNYFKTRVKELAAKYVIDPAFVPVIP